MPKTRRRRGGSMYEEGQVLEYDCNSPAAKGCECPKNGNKVVVEYFDNEQNVLMTHEPNDKLRTIPVYHKEIPCWKPVTAGGKRRRRRKTSKKGGSKRRRTRRRR